jgi:hypothetical protein
MIVATTYLLIAAVGRMPFLGEPRNLFLVHLVWATPLLLAMAHDFVRHRRVHPVYVFGLTLLLVSGSAVRGVVRSSEAWLEISARLVPWVT